MPIEQSRALVTAVPGPKSVALAARKAASVANGVGTIMPAYVVEASGGVSLDTVPEHVPLKVGSVKV